MCIISVAPPAPVYTSHVASDANDAAAAGGVATPVQAPTSAHICTSTCPWFDALGIEWDAWLTQDPIEHAADNFKETGWTRQDALNSDIEDVGAFLDTICKPV
jgi:hypothetical protein